MREHSGFMTFTVAACGDKAGKRGMKGMERQAQVGMSYWILEDGGWRMRWTVLDFILQPSSDKLHTQP